MSGIPLVDMGRWFSGDEVDRQTLGREVDAHLQRLGFLVVTNHGIDRQLIDRCRQASMEFFHLPAEEKRQVAYDPDSESGAYRGWLGPGLESNAATYGIDTPPDLKESFTCGPVAISDPALRTIAPRWYGENVWPENPPEFEAAMERWWLAAKELADELLDLFSLALGLPMQHLRSYCRNTTSNLTVNWYHPANWYEQGHEAAEVSPGQFRVGPHTDFGSLTILDRQPGMGGLQVLDESGNWIDAPYIPGSLVINTGDLLRRWTNDRWESNQHRVLPPPASDPDEELVSLVFFHEPDHDAQVAALETCVSQANPAKYEPIAAGDYLAEKMDALAVVEPGQ